MRVQLRTQPKTGYRTPYERSSGGYTAPVWSTSSAYELVDYLDVRGVVVWIEPLDAVAAGAIAADQRAADTVRSPVHVVVQPGGGRAVSLIAAGRGGDVVFHNRTDVAHLLYALDETGDSGFEIGRVGPAEERSIVAAEPGWYDILSESVDEPVARLFVAPGSWTAVSRSGRAVTFMNLPPGRYSAHCWHRRLPGQQKTFELEADQIAQVPLTLTVNTLPNVE